MPDDELRVMFEVIRRWVEATYPDREEVWLTIKLPGKGKTILPVPPPRPGETERRPAT